MVDRLLSYLLIAYFVVTSSILIVVAVILWALTAPFDRRLRALHLFSCFWGSLYVWSMPAWSVKTEGRDRARRDATYVIVSNHQSLVDILAAYRLFIHFKWVAKDELFRVPFIGWNMRLNRYIRIRRGDLESVREMMRAAAASLRRGSSVFMFPEGTRSETDDMRPFRSGAFSLAKNEKVAILPVAIHGSRHALPKGRLVTHGKNFITVRVLDEIPYEAFANTPVKQVAEDVRRRIGEALADIERSRSRSAP